MPSLTASRGRATRAGDYQHHDHDDMQLCKDGHVIDAGRDTCTRDGLPPYSDEFGTPITNPTEEIMTDEEVKTEEETTEESPKASEDSSVESSEDSATVAEEAAETTEEASTEESAETEGEATAEASAEATEETAAGDTATEEEVG